MSENYAVHICRIATCKAMKRTGTIISNYKVIVLYLFVLLLVQIVIGKVAYRQLRKKY